MVSRNDPCPCGSGKKYKFCCYLISTPLTVSYPSTGICNIQFDQANPPDVYFDTNVWRSMTVQDVENLKGLQKSRGFRYRYSITNYIELVTHLQDQDFKYVRSWFQKIMQLCTDSVLPSPEMEFLRETGLQGYLDSAWLPNIATTALAVELLANANCVQDLVEALPQWVINPTHYQMLREFDEQEMSKIMQSLNKLTGPISSSSPEFNDVHRWLNVLARFYLWNRPTSNKKRFDELSPAQRNLFERGLTYGAGRVFMAHWTWIVRKTVNEKRRIEPNDLYDSLQLIHLRDGNRLFVTNEKSFFLYAVEPEVEDRIKRVVHWDNFRHSA